MSEKENNVIARVFIENRGETVDCLSMCCETDSGINLSFTKKDGLLITSSDFSIEEAIKFHEDLTASISNFFEYISQQKQKYEGVDHA